MTTYSATSSPVYGGMFAPPAPAPSDIASVEVLRVDASGPKTTPDQTLSVSLHGSGTDPTAFGTLYEAQFSESASHAESTSMQWVATRGGVVIPGQEVTVIKPWDRHGVHVTGGGVIRQSYWMGWTLDTGAAGAKEMHLMTERRLDAILDWVDANIPNLSPTRRALSGGSMGGWGTLSYGIRRPDRFAALYPSRPRWRYSNPGSVTVRDYDYPYAVTYPVESAPPLAAGYGTGTVAQHLDIIAYVSNPANEIPWLGFCVGRNDGYMPFSDYVDAVAALRAAGRGFAFAWNDGNHSGGDIIGQVTATYPHGTFEIGKGYPVFSNHSLDQDPAVDLIGGINIGLKFRNVIESESAWSCEVTSATGACTVDVKPKSWIYTGSPSAQTVTITAANTWVTVSF